MRKKIGELALEKKWITRIELEEILQEQRQMRLEGITTEKSLLGELLCEQGLLSEPMLYTLLGEQMGWTARTLFQSLMSTGQPFQFGSYHVETFVASGGMGAVYQAIDSNTGRSVAIKIIHRDVLNEKIRKRFLREIKMLSRLEHPGIVKIHQYGQIDGVDFFVMDYLRGVPLDHALEKPFSLKQWLQKFVTLGQAVQAIHQQKIIHRDLKPSNIMLTNDNQLVIFDFGIGKIMEESRAGGKLTSHSIGTPAYMAPEQTFPGGQQDYQTDVWALGVIFYQLITKHLPFDAQNNHNLLENIRHYPSRPMTSYVAQIPWQLDAICQCALEKNKKQRYSNVAKMITDIQLFIEEKPLATAKRQTTMIKPFVRIGIVGLNIALLITTLGVTAFFLMYLFTSFDDLQKIIVKLEAHTPDITHFVIEYKFLLIVVSIALSLSCVVAFFWLGRSTLLNALFNFIAIFIVLLLIYICHWALTTPPTEMFRPKWMTIKQLSKYLQMSESKIQQLTNSEKIPALKIDNQWRYEKNEIDLWLRQLGQEEKKSKNE